MNIIAPSTFHFLKELRENNNREWFLEHKPIYQEVYANTASFMDTLIAEMRKVDDIVNESGRKSLFRIYNDVRFSKGKPPYKTHIGASLTRATRWLRGGYYLHFEPGNTFLGCGFWHPNPDDLKLIRDELTHDAQPLRNIMVDQNFKNLFNELKGETVKTAPRGFDKNHPNIDLIRYKSFYFERQISDTIALSDDFIFEVIKTFLTVRPFFDYMSEILTRHFE